MSGSVTHDQAVWQAERRLRSRLRTKQDRADFELISNELNAVMINQDERVQCESEQAQELLEKLPMLWKANGGCNCYLCIQHRGIRALLAMTGADLGPNPLDHNVIRRKQIIAAAKDGC